MAQLPSQGSRVEHPSYPHRMRPAIPRTERGSRIRRRGNRAGKRKFAYTMETHTGRGVVGSSVVRSFSDLRGQFVGAIAFTRGCERNFWSFAQTTWV